MDAPIWVHDEVVRAIHKRQIAEHGGRAGIRDDGLLTSALSRPRNVLAYGGDEIDMAALAAAYAFGIASNHPFVDGNRRVAYVVCRTFLRLNGADFEASAEEKYRTFVLLASGGIRERELAEWVRERRVAVG
jgi:death on curing protein